MEEGGNARFQVIVIGLRGLVVQVRNTVCTQEMCLLSFTKETWHCTHRPELGHKSARKPAMLYNSYNRAQNWTLGAQSYKALKPFLRFV